MRAIAFTLLLIAFPVFGAELIARDGDNEVRLFDSPCVHAETLGRLPPPMREKYSKATGRFQGQMFYGCWRLQGNAAVVIWEDGDQGLIPVADLKPAMDI
jgi:hypothetical protein